MMNAPKPRVLSIANFLAYLINSLETFGVGPFSSSFAPGQDNASISEKYQTIITPNGIAFSIWGLIFLSEALFVICTLVFPRYMNDPLAVKGVSFWFVLACLAQTLWSPAFAYENIPLSAVFMGCILVPLAVIVVNQYSVASKVLEQNNNAPAGWKDYFFLRFPFELHLGWIAAAFALNVNVLAVPSGGSATTQLIVAGISLAILTAVSIACLLAIERPQYTLPSVATWATAWMSYELRNPKELVQTTFSSDQIETFRILTSAISTILAAFTIARWLQRQYCAQRREAAPLQEEEVDENERIYSSIN